LSWGRTRGTSGPGRPPPGQSRESGRRAVGHPPRPSASAAGAEPAEVALGRGGGGSPGTQGSVRASAGAPSGAATAAAGSASTSIDRPVAATRVSAAHSGAVGELRLTSRAWGQCSNPMDAAANKRVIERRTSIRARRMNDGDRAAPRRATRSTVSGLLDVSGRQRGSDGQGPAEMLHRTAYNG